MGKFADKFEEAIYVISCILTLGALWVLKITIKRAIIEGKREDAS